MASNENPTPQVVVGVEALSRAFTEALAPLQPKTKITIANRKVMNPMNPENKPRKWERDFYQNFAKVDPQDVFQDEYELIPKLREGSYIADDKEGFLFEVVEVRRGSNRGIHLRYSNATPDKRMQLMVKAGATLGDMLRAILADADKQKVASRARRRAEDQD